MAKELLVDVELIKECRISTRLGTTEGKQNNFFLRIKNIRILILYCIDI